MYKSVGRSGRFIQRQTNSFLPYYFALFIFFSWLFVATQFPQATMSSVFNAVHGLRSTKIRTHNERKVLMPTLCSTVQPCKVPLLMIFLASPLFYQCGLKLQKKLPLLSGPDPNYSCNFLFKDTSFTFFPPR